MEEVPGTSGEEGRSASISPSSVPATPPPSAQGPAQAAEECMDHDKRKMSVVDLKARVAARKALAEEKKKELAAREPPSPRSQNLRVAKNNLATRERRRLSTPSTGRGEIDTMVESPVSSARDAEKGNDKEVRPDLGSTPTAAVDARVEGPAFSPSKQTWKKRKRRKGTAQKEHEVWILARLPQRQPSTDHCLPRRVSSRPWAAKLFERSSATPPPCKGSPKRLAWR